MSKLNQIASLQKNFDEVQTLIMSRKVVAFDLDNTLIDSNHRVRIDENGVFDLDYWRKHSTWEYISKDTLLPCYFEYLTYKQLGCRIIAVTARQLNEYDFKYFKKYNLIFDEIIQRGNSLELDEELKNRKLNDFFDEMNGKYFPYIAFDDKEENLKVFEKHGFKAFNANVVNLYNSLESFEAIRDHVNEGNITHYSPKQEHLLPFFRK